MTADLSSAGSSPAAALPRVLVIGDDPTSVRLVAGILEGECTTLAAPDAKQGFSMACEESPDLILLDQNLPDDSGIFVCRRLKEIPELADIPVLFITVDHDPVAEVAALEAGGCDFVTKPYSPAVLRSRVRTQLALREKTTALRKLARFDELTGLYNRRTMFEELAKEWETARRCQQWITIGMLDIDRFKQFNDQFGHQLGDACLRQTAECLADRLNHPGYFVARYGGEEFLFVLPHTDAFEAGILFESVRVAAAALQVNTGEESPNGQAHHLSITASIGYAARIPTSDDHYYSLIREADANLLVAKEQGRNRVEPTPLTRQQKTSGAPEHQRS